MKKTLAIVLSLGVAATELSGCRSQNQQQGNGPDVDSVKYEIIKQDEGDWRDMERGAFGDDTTQNTPDEKELRRLYQEKHN
jgi:predicted small secreted protein